MLNFQMLNFQMTQNQCLEYRSLFQAIQAIQAIQTSQANQANQANSGKAGIPVSRHTGHSAGGFGANRLIRQSRYSSV